MGSHPPKPLPTKEQLDEELDRYMEVTRASLHRQADYSYLDDSIKLERLDV